MAAAHSETAGQGEDTHELEVELGEEMDALLPLDTCFWRLHRGLQRSRIGVVSPFFDLSSVRRVWLQRPRTRSQRNSPIALITDRVVNNAREDDECQLVGTSPRIVAVYRPRVGLEQSLMPSSPENRAAYLQSVGRYIGEIAMVQELESIRSVPPNLVALDRALREQNLQY